jgi:hypothetical protein
MAARVRGPADGGTDGVRVQEAGQAVTWADGAGGRTSGDVGRRSRARRGVRAPGDQGERGRGRGWGDAPHWIVDRLSDELGVERVRQHVRERRRGGVVVARGIAVLRPIRKISFGRNLQKYVN